MNLIEASREKLFGYVHGSNLVYNTCWEDPRCDRQLMDIDSESEIVMITSAGCNALDYLLDDPAQIHCVDMNVRQNAILELKKALFRLGDFDKLFAFFGKGGHSSAVAWYEVELRNLLPAFAKDYLDKFIHAFDGKGLRSSYYFYGTSGTFAWMSRQFLRAKKSVAASIDAFFEASTIEEQKKLYHEIEPSLITNSTRWFLNRHLTMCLLGVPKSQQELFNKEYQEGATGFIRKCMHNVFTKLPIHDNYFYRVYWTGQYTKTCCPEYLKEANFSTLRKRETRIQTHTTTVAEFLKNNPGKYSHFVMLDHQDWLAANHLDALNEEWELILANSRPGTKILLRSAAEKVDFFPDFVKERVHFEKEMTAKTHQEDRVGTYASVYLAIVK